MNDAYAKVRQFHEALAHPVAETPTLLAPERLRRRLAFMREELDELEAAEDLVAQVDALMDLMYFALGSLVEMGVRPDGPFDIVHGANMRKIGGGKDALGKTQKPEGWVPPEEEIQADLERQRGDR